MTLGVGHALVHAHIRWTVLGYPIHLPQIRAQLLALPPQAQVARRRRQRQPHVFARGVTLRLPHLQRPFGDLSQHGRHPPDLVGRPADLRPTDAVEQSLLIGFIVQRPRRQALKQQDARREQVRAKVELLPQHLLGAHVVDFTFDKASLCLRVAVGSLGDPKVGQLDLAH